jgi:hypothetical protein
LSDVDDVFDFRKEDEAIVVISDKKISDPNDKNWFSLEKWEQILLFILSNPFGRLLYLTIVSFFERQIRPFPAPIKIPPNLKNSSVTIHPFTKVKSRGRPKNKPKKKTLKS